jgi:ABC-type glycerol-3-phosphate transport system substrate-binding protein
MTIALASLALAAALTAGAASAQTSQPSTREACASDVKAYCANVKPGPGNPLTACIRQNESKLSAGCKEAIKRQRGKSL